MQVDDQQGDRREHGKELRVAEQRRGGGGSLAFVGDSSYDVAAARAARVPVIGARYGYCDKPAQDLGADAVIDSFDALIPALRGLA